MAATPFKPITWAPYDNVDKDRLNQMANNDLWLLDNKIGGNYNAHGVRRTIDLRIACGLALITARKEDRAVVEVRFNDYFSPNSKPIVTTGTVSASQRRLITTIDGIGQLHPDSRGFRVHSVIESESKKNKRLMKNFYVSWIALGY